MLSGTQARSARPLQLALAFAAIYLIWGSTYLAIRFAIETIPPLLMAGARFLIAGGALYAWVAIRGKTRRPTREQWAASALLGILFFLGGNGGVSWAEQRVPSGLAALLVATIPFWIVLIDWIRPGGSRPSARILLGVAAGFSGVALLVVGRGGQGSIVDPIGAAVLMIAEISWASGTVSSRHLPHPASHLQSGAMQMLAGGAALSLAGIGTGELARLHLGGVSARSLLSFVYLIGAGSIVAFSAYNWLLEVTTPSRVGTYAFVNPAVAVLLGWAFAGEAIGPTILLAGAAILAGILLILAARTRGPSAGAPGGTPARPLTNKGPAATTARPSKRSLV